MKNRNRKLANFAELHVHAWRYHCAQWLDASDHVTEWLNRMDNNGYLLIDLD